MIQNTTVALGIKNKPPGFNNPDRIAIAIIDLAQPTRMLPHSALGRRALAMHQKLLQMQPVVPRIQRIVGKGVPQANVPANLV